VGIISDGRGNCKLTADDRCFLIQPRLIPRLSSGSLRHNGNATHKEPTMSETDNFRHRVLQIIAAIPYGQVTTYGNVAQLAGSPRAARQVGGVLRKLPEGSTLPWHRVINRHGEISQQGEDFKRQRQALLEEGIMFEGGQIDLEKYGWKW